MIHSVNESVTIGKDAMQNYDNVSDSVYYCIGALMTIIMIFGFFANFVIIYTFGTNKKVRTVDNTLIIGLALSDIGQSIFGLPFVVIASFSKRWIFGHALCQYYAFVTTWFGIAQIATLTIIAMERYFVIVKMDRRMTSTACRSVMMILFSFVYGSVWATGPLLGWSKYKQEDIGIACCVTWEVQDKLSLSYTMSICTFGWFIPLFLIAYGYTSIACSVSTIIIILNIYQNDSSTYYVENNTNCKMAIIITLASNITMKIKIIHFFTLFDSLALIRCL
jgi:hypothetical protein